MAGKRGATTTTSVPRPRETLAGRHAAARQDWRDAYHQADPLSTASVLIVGVNYAPEELGIAPLTTAMARELAMVAERVTVFTGIPHYPAGLLPMVYRGQRRSYGADDVVRVVRHRHHLPPAGPAGVAMPLTRRFGRSLDQARYQAGFARSVLMTPVRHPPTLVIGVLPSVGGGLAAARLAQRYGVPLLLMVHDADGTASGNAGKSGNAGNPQNYRGGGPLGSALAIGRSWVFRQATRVLIVRDQLPADAVSSRCREILASLQP